MRLPRSGVCCLLSCLLLQAGLVPAFAVPAETDTDLDGIVDSQDPDDDNDGMPDSFELGNALDPLDAVDAGQDADGDAATNGAEFRAGSDPHDPASVPPALFLRQFRVFPGDAAAGDEFGSALAVHAGTALIGAPGNYAAAVGGVAYVYERQPDDSWQQQAVLFPQDSAGFSRYGSAVAVHGDTAVVGAAEDDDNDANAGAVYVYRRDAGGNWLPEGKLLATGGAADDRFGLALAVEGDLLAIGARRHDDGAQDTGSVYIFGRDAGGSWTQQARLLAPDASLRTQFGRSVALSGDSLAVGAAWDAESGAHTGAVYVYTRDAGGLWSLQQKLLPPDSGDELAFGASVAISGATLITGSAEDGARGYYAGAAYVFTRDGTGFWSQAAKLLAGDGGSNDLFGNAVALDGVTALVAAPGDRDRGADSGSVYVFRRLAGSQWVQQAKLLSRTGRAGDFLGRGAVAVSGDELVIAAAGNDENGVDAGLALLYVVPADTDADSDGIPDWGDTCPADPAAAQRDSDADTVGDACDTDDDNDGVPDAVDSFATNPNESADSDADGTGDNADRDADNDGMPDSYESANGLDALNPADALQDPDGDGHTSLDEMRAGTDPQDPALHPGLLEIRPFRFYAGDAQANDRFGSALASDANYAVVGAAFDSNSNGTRAGSAYVYQRMLSGGWQQVAALRADNGAAHDNFGQSVAVSGDTILVGANRATGQSAYTGAAYVFVRGTNGNWIQQARLSAADGRWGDYFGWSVAVTGDRAVVGAFQHDTPEPDSGAVYVFERDAGGVWSAVQKLTASDAAAGDDFGNAVAIGQDTIVVGSGSNDTAVTDGGAVYVFERDQSGNWHETARLVPAAPVQAEHFGLAVSVSGGVILAGASHSDVMATDAGAAYVFEQDAAGVWQEHALLTAADAQAADHFGQSVDVAGDIAVIGAWASDAAGTDSGSGYIYLRDSSGGWLFQGSLAAGGITAGDFHAGAVSISGSDVLAGAYGDDDYGSQAGAAYGYSLDPDGDGLLFAADNCPLHANPGQIDPDGDGLGNACDTDDDNDQLPDSVEDQNGNGKVDAGETDPRQADTDGDGVDDGIEVAEGTDPLDPASYPFIPDGDVNLDGSVDTGDLVTASRILAGLEAITPAQRQQGDVAPFQSGLPRPNGVFDAADYAVIRRKILGIVNF